MTLNTSFPRIQLPDKKVTSTQMIDVVQRLSEGPNMYNTARLEFILIDFNKVVRKDMDVYHLVADFLQSFPHVSQSLHSL